ncbi:DNA-binding XRE family transcriptional regulator [Chitinophaga skermanii]|uniref:DNA-binding XRE family transcriptional regulator n=1 Tax=Chitinophaga skermanii TaxID=331697 RepID=A0A327PXB7_9BACT|nr:helix-turn-helix transcriptional regulator [Chitinophaga skermanii]RAI96975.1 DNA-binding XRE family transcriptional regulator [Chitinophaga skermanii]
MDKAKVKYNRLKAVLAEKDLTGSELGIMAGISSQTISKWATNKQQPRLDQVFKIAKLLGVHPHRLLDLSSIEENK